MFIVFQDSLNGFTHIPELGAETLKDTLQLIENHSNQNWMFFIYQLYQNNVSLFGTKFNVHKYVKAVKGAKTEACFVTKKTGHQYALDCNSSMAWLFSDNLFGVDEVDDEEDE